MSVKHRLQIDLGPEYDFQDYEELHDYTDIRALNIMEVAIILFPNEDIFI